MQLLVLLVLLQQLLHGWVIQNACCMDQRQNSRQRKVHRGGAHGRRRNGRRAGGCSVDCLSLQQDGCNCRLLHHQLQCCWLVHEDLQSWVLLNLLLDLLLLLLVVHLVLYSSLGTVSQVQAKAG
jgi:hypothetical protein